MNLELRSASSEWSTLIKKKKRVQIEETCLAGMLAPSMVKPGVVSEARVGKHRKRSVQDTKRSRCGNTLNPGVK